MTSPRHPYYVLPSAAARRRLRHPLGTLTPLLTHAPEPAEFTAYDHFDQPLRQAGRLLLADAHGLHLLGSGGVAAHQPGKEKPGFVADLNDGPVKQALAGLSPLRRLLPVGSGEWRPSTLALVDDEGKTHCRVHSIWLRTRENDAIVLLRLQELKGYGSSFKLLCEHIDALGGQAGGFHNLYERLFPNTVAYDARPEIPIADDATAFETANRIISTHIPVMRANESGIIADHDTEFLHDYRIQLRKIRSVLSLFKGVYTDDQTAALKAAFSALAEPTGALRDLDVYLLDERQYHGLLPEALHDGLDALSDTLRRKRAEAHAQVARHLLSRAYEREITALARRFSKKGALKPGLDAGRLAPEFARDCIWKRYRKVRKTANAIDAHTPDAAVHALRIHCKKLRYLIEFFGPLFPPKELEKVLRPLKALQNNLGRFNDCSVQQDKLHGLLRRSGEDAGGDAPRIGPSVGALITILHGLQKKERAKVVRSVRRFDRATTRRTFSELFQPRKKDEDHCLLLE